MRERERKCEMTRNNNNNNNRKKNLKFHVHRCLGKYIVMLTCEAVDCPCNLFPLPTTNHSIYLSIHTSRTVSESVLYVPSRAANRCAPKKKITERTTTTLTRKNGIWEKKANSHRAEFRTQWNCKHVWCMRRANVGKNRIAFSNHIIIIHIEHITFIELRACVWFRERTMWQNVSHCTGCDDDYDGGGGDGHDTGEIPDFIRSTIVSCRVVRFPFSVAQNE